MICKPLRTFLAKQFSIWGQITNLGLFGVKLQILGYLENFNFQNLRKPRKLYQNDGLDASFETARG